MDGAEMRNNGTLEVKDWEFCTGAEMVKLEIEAGHPGCSVLYLAQESLV
jgi:hypothetical protein